MAAMTEQRVTRDQLYNLIWSKPITKVAEEIGVSDSMIIKACKKLDVPRPPAGHWAKVRAGKKTTIRKLKPKKGNTQTAHTFFRTITPKVQQQMAESQLHPLIEREHLPEYKITVSTNLTALKSISKQNLKSFNASKVNDNNKIQARLAEHFDLRISKETVSRSIFIVDALLSAFESRNWVFNIEPSRDKHQGMTVSLLGETFYFWIEEKNTRIKHIETPQERRKKFYWAPPWDYISTGKLSLRLGDHSNYYSNRSFNDGKTQVVEDRLNAFCIALVEMALTKKEVRRKDELEQKAQERREIRRKGLNAAKESELRRREELEADFQKWLRAEKIREFIQVREKRFELDKHSAEDIRDFRAVQEWSKNYANIIDPLAQGVPTIVEELT